MGLLEFMMELDSQYYLEVKNIISFTSRLSVKCGIAYIISHNYAKIKIDSYNFLPLEKAITFHNVIILITSVFNKDKNNNYYKILLEKTFHEFPKK